MPHFSPDLGRCLLVPTLQYCAQPSSLGLHPYPTSPDSSNLSIEHPFQCPATSCNSSVFPWNRICLLALNRKPTIPLSLQLLSGTSSGSLGEVAFIPLELISLLHNPLLLQHIHPPAFLIWDQGIPLDFFPFFTSTRKPSEIPVDFTFKLYSWGSLPLSLLPTTTRLVQAGSSLPWIPAQ